MKLFWALCWLAGVWAALGAAWAQEADTLDKVRAEMAEVEAYYQQRARECHQKLNVNDCRQEVQAGRSRDIQPIQARLRTLESAVRQERAESRRTQIRQRQAEHDARVGAPADAAPHPQSNPAETR